MENVPLLVATLAPIVNSIELFPQLHKTVSSQNVDGISLQWLLVMMTANILWLLHGYFKSDPSLIIAVLFQMVINLILLYYYFEYRDGKSRRKRKANIDTILIADEAI